MDAPRRERRHHRKVAPAAGVGAGAGVCVAGGGAAAARAAYGDVFGGPPRFAAPFGGAPADYAEVFGGVATTCSIPFLDLPPAAAVDGDDGCFGLGGAGDYGEIFARFDFGDFALPYEELFGEPEPEPEAERELERGAEEIASSSWSARSLIKRERNLLDTEPFIFPQHFKENESSSAPLPPVSQHCVMSYNKTTQGRLSDVVEMAACTVDSSMDCVVDSCNFSHAPTPNHVSRIDNCTIANGDNRKKAPHISASDSVNSPEEDFIIGLKQHVPASSPISEHVSADESNQNSHCHSTPSNGTASTDYPFLRVSDVNVQTQPKVPAHPLRQQPKVLNRRESATKGEAHLVNHTCTPAPVHAILTTSMPQAERRTDAALFRADSNPSSAAAAMKEAMEYADTKLRAAKELMERKGDSFKLRKKPSHHRSTRSTEIKTLVDVDASEEKLSAKKPAKGDNPEDSSLDKHQEGRAVRLDHCDDDGKKILPLNSPQHTMQHCPEPCETSSKLETLGKWKSGDEFFELTGDDHKCKTDTDTEKEVNCERINPVTKLPNDQKNKIEVTAADSDLERYEKLWEVNDGRDVGVKHVKLREENAASMEKEGVSIVLEACIENLAHKKNQSSRFEEVVTGGNSKQSHDNESVHSSKPECIKDMSSSFSEAFSSGDHPNDVKGPADSNVRENPVAGTSQESQNNKEGLETARYDETQSTSGTGKKLQDPPEVANVGNSQTSQIKSLILEELEGSYVNQTFPRGLSTAEPEAETYGREKFSFIDESFLHNENHNITEVPPEALVFEVVKVGTEAEVVPRAHSEEAVLDQDTECPEGASNINLQSNNLSEHEESNVFNVFEVASKLIKRDLDQEIHGSLRPGEVENRTEGTVGLVSDCEYKEAEEIPSENSEKKAGSEERSAHDSHENQTASETNTNNRQCDVDAQANTTIDELGSIIHAEDEVTMEAVDDCPTRITKDEPASSSDLCIGMQHLTQSAEPAASETFKKSVPGAEKTDVVCKESERVLPAERSSTFKEEKSSVNKMEEKDYREKISKEELSHQQSHLEKSGGLPKSAEIPFTVSSEASRKEAPGIGIERTKERVDITNAERERERDKEASRKLEEAKERERRFQKERENAEERERRKLEEQERAREREKDRLAVERAAREAHERAFAEARERAEKMASERITAARQRASAEAREKEERASAEATAERAAREARIKAERAAVERATAEARERAIEKAKAEKAAADVRERKERYRSSLKESSRFNLDVRQDTQFQRAKPSSFVRNPDSSIKAVEVETALRHKARLERHQRTTERVSKALAEKNMRDLLAQREQAEKHRLAEFLDPEVKRWSNGKEGNLRALLSTLQYILGADSGWQPVPLTDLITAVAVKKAYRKATLCVHPDKLQQRGATIRQKYICEKVFDLLKDAWNRFTSEER